jgi:hypothetical protein
LSIRRFGYLGMARFDSGPKEAVTSRGDRAAWPPAVVDLSGNGSGGDGVVSGGERAETGGVLFDMLSARRES